MGNHGSTTEVQEALRGIFEEHRSDVSWLVFLLTGDPGKSANALRRVIDFRDGANAVFRGFMVSWVEKLVIAEALATMDSQLRDSVLRSQAPHSAQPERRPPLTWILLQSVTKPEFERAVLALDLFPRCAVLLTTFEGLSVEDAALLLNADAEFVRSAQSRGLIELERNIARGRGWAPDDTARSEHLQYALI